MKEQKDPALPVLANGPGGPRVSDRQDRAIGMLGEGTPRRVHRLHAGDRAVAAPVVEETSPVPQGVGGPGRGRLVPGLACPSGPRVPSTEGGEEWVRVRTSLHRDRLAPVP